MSKLANLNKENLFEMEFTEIKTENSGLPTYLFEEIETELSNFTTDKVVPKMKLTEQLKLLKI